MFSSRSTVLALLLLAGPFLLSSCGDRGPLRFHGGVTVTPRGIYANTHYRGRRYRPVRVHYYQRPYYWRAYRPYSFYPYLTSYLECRHGFYVVRNRVTWNCYFPFSWAHYEIASAHIDHALEALWRSESPQEHIALARKAVPMDDAVYDDLTRIEETFDRADFSDRETASRELYAVLGTMSMKMVREKHKK